MKFRATEKRVCKNTSDEINERNRRAIDDSVMRYARISPAGIDQRIRELEAEWDIVRALEANAAAAVMTSVALALVHDRRWLALTGLAGIFLLQQALQGWCPPVAILRRIGVRTTAEIDEEKTALRIMRGDFYDTGNPREALAQVRNGHVQSRGAAGKT